MGHYDSYKILRQRSVIGKASTSASSFKIRAAILSGPVAQLTSNSRKRLNVDLVSDGEKTILFAFKPSYVLVFNLRGEVIFGTDPRS